MSAHGPDGAPSRPAAGGAGLYLHVPFCSAVCPYCDFAVHTGTQDDRDAFVAALLAEIALWQDWPHEFDSIYLGGGTPSALSVSQLARILEAVERHLPVSASAKLFLEVNPEDVDAASIAGWRALGVHMLSLGVQSFNDDELRRLGRRHRGDEAKHALSACLEAGFHTVSCDLMFGLPRQTPADVRRNLEALTSLQPPHVSCYQLTIHEGTTFWRWRERGKLSELDESTQAELYFELTAGLEALGLAAYEVSNFARSREHRSAHNQKYWGHVPYLGLGPSAHSFDGRCRWWNLRRTADWRERVLSARKATENSEQLSDAELALETVMLRVRTRDGLDLDEFQSRFGTDLAISNAALIGDLVSRGLIVHEARTLRPTIAGLAVADGLAALFEL